MMLKISKTIISVFFVFLLISCDNYDTKKLFKYADENLNKNHDAANLVCKEIQSRKIVFISELHNEINPYIFLSENMQNFYDAGVRYIFIEGGNPEAFMKQTEPYFPFFYPWPQCGWRYEEKMFSDSVLEINLRVPENQKIQVISAEEDMPDELWEEGGMWDIETEIRVFLRRDEYAAEKIKTVMQNTNDKALIVYGSSHGLINIVPKFDMGHGKSIKNWNPLGHRLKEIFGNDFISFGYVFLKGFDYKPEETIYGSFGFYESEIKDLIPSYYLNWYDAFIVEDDDVYGIPYVYKPTEENLEFIFNQVCFYADYIEELKNNKNDYIGSDFGQLIAGIYYLKMYYGDKFDYQLWNPKRSLKDVTEELKKQIAQDGFNNVLGVKNARIDFDDNQVRDYMRYMSAGWELEMYSKNQYKKKWCPWLLTQTDAAKNILGSQDLWAVYWDARVRTTCGKYEEALKEYETLLENPLVYSMPVLPVIYKKAALCEEKLGYKDIATQYKEKIKKLGNEFDESFENFEYFGNSIL